MNRRLLLVDIPVSVPERSLSVLLVLGPEPQVAVVRGHVLELPEAAHLVLGELALVHVARLPREDAPPVLLVVLELPLVRGVVSEGEDALPQAPIVRESQVS